MRATQDHLHFFSRLADYPAFSGALENPGCPEFQPIMLPGCTLPFDLLKFQKCCSSAPKEIG